MISHQSINLRKHFFLILIILQIFIMGSGVWGRPIDHDEGFYLSASSLISEGKWLYKDFFYPQMPLFPHFMAGVGKVIGFSLLANRIIAMLCSLGISVVIVLYLSNRFRDFKRGWLAALVPGYLYAMHSLTVNWHTISKPYPHSELLVLVASVLLLAAYEQKVKFKKRLFLSGLLLGTAWGIKLYYLPLIIPFSLFIIGNKDQNNPERWRAIKYFWAGGLIPAAFTLFFLFLDSENFIFANIHYHSLNAKWRISTRYLGTWWPDKLKMFYYSFWGWDVTRYALSGAVAAALILWLLMKSKIIPSRKVADNYKPEALFAMIVLTQSATYLLLTPYQEQYMVTIVPFLALLSAVFWNWLINNVRYGVLTTMVLLLFYIHPATLRGIDWIRKREFSQINRVKSISRELARVTGPDDEVFSLWPAYAVLARRKITPGMESGGFGYRIAYQLTDRQAKRHHILKRPAIMKKLQHGQYPVVVAGLDWQYLKLRSKLTHYRKIYREPGSWWSILAGKDFTNPIKVP